MQKSVAKKNKKNLTVESPNKPPITSTNISAVTNSNLNSDNETNTLEFANYERDNGQNDGFKIPNGNPATSNLKLGPSTQTSFYTTLQTKESNNINAMNANNNNANVSAANSGLVTPGTLLGNLTPTTTQWLVQQFPPTPNQTLPWFQQEIMQNAPVVTPNTNVPPPYLPQSLPNNSNNNNTSSTLLSNQTQRISPTSLNSGNYFYVEPVEDDLLCSLCKKPMTEPVTHVSCQASFCTACIAKESKCPQCREKLVNKSKQLVPSSRIIINMLNKLKVKCPTCSNIFARAEISGHFENCGNCPFMCKPPLGQSHAPDCFFLPFQNIFKQHQVRIQTLESENQNLKSSVEKLRAEFKVYSTHSSQRMEQLEKQVTNSNTIIQNLYKVMSQSIRKKAKTGSENTGSGQGVPQRASMATQAPVLGSVPTDPIMISSGVVRSNETRSYPVKSTIDLQTKTPKYSIYAFGGFDADSDYQSSVEQWNSESNTWSNFRTMESTRSFHSAVAFGDCVLLLGGRKDSSTYLNSVEKFPLGSNGKSQSLVPLSVSRSFHGSVKVGNSVITVGGWNEKGILNSCERYNLEANIVENLPPMSEQRYGHGLVVTQDANCIYAVGGSDGPSYQRSVEMLDLRTCKWEKISSMSKGRLQAFVGLVNNTIYAFGGKTGSEIASSGEIFDITKNTWTEHSESLEIGKWYGATVVVPFSTNGVSDKLYLLGGTDSRGNFLNSVDIFDCKSLTWSAGISMKSKRRGLAAVLVED